MIERCRRPTILTVFIVLPGFGNDVCRSAHVLDELGTCFLRRQLVKIGWITGEVTKIKLVLRFRIVIYGAVITATRERPGQAVRQGNFLGDLMQGVAVVGETQYFVMDVAIGISLNLPELDNLFIAPGRPVMAAERNLDVVPEELNRLVDVLRPFKTIAHLGAA